MTVPILWQLQRVSENRVSASPSPLRTVTGGLLSLVIAMGIGRFLFTPLLPLMRDEGRVTIADAGLIASVHFLGYLLGALFAVHLTRAPRRTFRVSLLTIAVATLGMGLTDTYLAWLVFRFLCGVCSALILVLISSYTLKHMFKIGQAHRQGWVFSGVGAGMAFAGLATLALMTGGLDSRVGWLGFGTLSLAGALGLSVVMNDAMPETGASSSSSTAARTRLIWRNIIAYGAMGVGYVVPATYLPAMAREVIGSPLVFGWSWPIFGFAAFLSTLIAARLNRTFGNRQIWAVSQTVMAFGVLLPAFLSGIVPILVAALCVGGTFMTITMAGMKEVHRTAPADQVQRHIAAMTASFAFGQMVGPVLAGWAYEATGSFAAPLVAAGVALGTTVIPLLRDGSAKAPAGHRTGTSI